VICNRLTARVRSIAPAKKILKLSAISNGEVGEKSPRDGENWGGCFWQSMSARPKIQGIPMSTARSVVGPSKFSKFERALLIFASVFLLSDAVGGYVSMHTDRIIETIILSLLLILVGGVFAIVVVVRIIILISVCRFGQRWLASSALLAYVALFATFPFMGAAAVFYVLDQLRFHINKSFYVTEVEKSNTSPKFLVFDWGKTEFVGSRTHYFLVFDPNNSIARGLADPMDMPLPNEGTKCGTSVLPLHGSFYSVTVNCELT
jgi:hypothetical protein